MNKTIRHTVKIRANFLCEYCFCSEFFSPDPFEVDHIISIAKGGVDDTLNFALSCRAVMVIKATQFKLLTLLLDKWFLYTTLEKIFGQNIFVGMNISLC